MKKLLAALVIIAASALAQEGTPVNVSISSPLVSWSSILKYSGSDLITICKARSQQPTATFSVSGSTPYVLTSVVVLTNVGTVTTVSDHGLNIGDKVTFSGATVDSDLNGIYRIATVPTSKTYTLSTSAVANGTYTESTLQFATNAPRTTQPIWAIEELTYVSSAATSIKWANGTSAPNQICDNSATLPSQ